MSFVHLNVKSHASFQRSSVKIDGLMKEVDRLGFSSIALTDYGNVYNAISFYSKAVKSNIKPIMGVEAFFVINAHDSKIQQDRRVCHVTLLAENNVGWQNICRIISDSNSPENYYFRNRVDFKILEKHKEGIIVLTGGTFDGIIPYHLYDKTREDGTIAEPKAVFKANSLLNRFISIFGRNNVFVELQDHGFSVQTSVNDLLRNMARSHGVACVATNNVHYLRADNAASHRTLRSMSYNAHNPMTLTDFENEEYFVKSEEEMEQLSFTPEELDMSGIIADRCNVVIDLSTKRLPSYPFLEKGHTAKSQLRMLATKGLKTRNLPNTQEYLDRLNKELDDIHEMGFDDYFLIVWDVCNWIQRSGIKIGFGRGSAGGSLVSFCLGVTEIDPIPYKLMWERFLNKGRDGLPDIDTDVPRSRRKDVLKYIQSRFGSESVAQIVTFNGMQARAILKEVFSVYNLPFEEANIITQLIPSKNEDHTAITLAQAIERVPALKEYSEKYRAWFEIASELEGCYKSLGTHAAAVVISDCNFGDSNYPLCRAADGKSLIFSYDMGSVDKLNLLKLDILGLSTLDDISTTTELVSKRHGVQITRETTPLADSKSYDLIATGKTAGIFQIDKQLGRHWSKELRPESIEELAALISLIRPGTLDSGETLKYKERKQNLCTPAPPDPSLSLVLKDTLGIMVYQEQQIAAAQILTGWDLSRCDLLRRAIGKKKLKEMQSFKDDFYADAKKLGHHDEMLDVVWNVLEKSAGYSFNRCLSGETIVTRAGSNSISNREVSIEELWSYFHGDNYKTHTGKKYRNKNHPKRGLRILMYRDERAYPGRVLDVVKNGIKETVNVTTSDGKSLRGTRDHRVLTEDGWKTIGELIIGQDRLVVSDLRYEITTNEYFNKISRVSVGKRIFKKNVPFYGVGSANTGYIDGNSIKFKEQRLSKIKNINCCELCFNDSKRLEIAHLDGCHTNQSADNLKLLCVSCHKKHDYKYNGRTKRFEKGYPTNYSVVTSISDARFEETYDIEMAEVEHNFFANGIVTHNSHAVGYALLAYEAAYLKANYPLEFFCAKLRNSQFAQDPKEEIKKLINDAKLFNIQVIPPRLSAGNMDFEIIDDNSIAFGLSALKGIGKAAVKSLEKTSRSITDPEDLLWMFANSAISKTIVEALIKGGALDDYKLDRVRWLSKYRLLSDLTQNELSLIQDLIKESGIKEWMRPLKGICNEDRLELVKSKYPNSFKANKLPNVNRRGKIRDYIRLFESEDLFDSLPQNISWECHFLGIGLSGNPADIYKSKDKCKDIANFPSEGRYVDLAVTVESVKEIITRKSPPQPMAFLTAGDNTYTLENIVVFPRVFEQCHRLLEAGAVLRIKGKLDERGGVLVDKIERMK